MPDQPLGERRSARIYVQGNPGEPEGVWTDIGEVTDLQLTPAHESHHLDGTPVGYGDLNFSAPLMRDKGWRKRLRTLYDPDIAYRQRLKESYLRKLQRYQR